MWTIWAAEMLFLAILMCGLGVVVAVRARMELIDIEAKMSARNAALGKMKRRFIEMKESFEALQTEHADLKEQVDGLSGKADYMERVLEHMRASANIPSAESAKVILEAVVDGMNNNTAPDRTARNVINLSFATPAKKGGIDQPDSYGSTSVVKQNALHKTAVRKLRAPGVIR